MGLTWREAASIELVESAFLTDAEGVRQTRLTGVGFAVEGGYLHIRVPGRDEVQVVSAPMVRHLAYQG